MMATMTMIMLIVAIMKMVLPVPPHELEYCSVVDVEHGVALPGKWSV